MYKILGLVGSTSGTKTRIAMDSFASKVDPNQEFTLLDLKDLDTVFADGRDYRDYTGDTKLIIDSILESDALVIGMPVYQSSFPGVLKNILDLLPIDSLRDKPIGIITTAGTSKHFLVPEYQLKPVLKYMKADVLDSYVFIEDTSFINNMIQDDDVDMRLDRLAYQLLETLELQAELKQKREDAFDF